jgi:hypothetical protein
MPPESVLQSLQLISPNYPVEGQPTGRTRKLIEHAFLCRDATSQQRCFKQVAGCCRRCCANGPLSPFPFEFANVSAVDN